MYVQMAAHTDCSAGKRSAAGPPVGVSRVPHADNPKPTCSAEVQLVASSRLFLWPATTNKAASRSWELYKPAEEQRVTRHSLVTHGQQRRRRAASTGGSCLGTLQCVRATPRVSTLAAGPVSDEKGQRSASQETEVGRGPNWDGPGLQGAHDSEVDVRGAKQ